MCRRLGLAPSSFSAWQQRQRPDAVPSAQAQHQQDLRTQIQTAFGASRHTYGCRRVRAALVQQGVPVSVGTVAQLMRQLGLQGRTRPRFHPTTTLGAAPFARPDLVQRQFAPADHRPGHTLVSDLTYLPTQEGWLYLAVVLDLGSRAVLGWAMADHLRTGLVTDALAAALGTGVVGRGAILHSDRGTQYTATAFTQAAQGAGLRLSCGATGVCWDNAVAEAFFATLKTELVHGTVWRTHAEARPAVLAYIEGFYNRQRLHSRLGDQAPWTILTQPGRLPLPAPLPHSTVQAA